MAAQHSLPDNEAPSVLLEIAMERHEPPVQMPVTVKSLSRGLVTLEVRHSWPKGWDDWDGRESHLYLAFPGADETHNIPGIVSWVRYTGDYRRPLVVGMELARADLMTHKLLEDCLPHSRQDIKRLWDGWDQARENQVYPVVNPKIFSTGLALLLGGLVLQLAEPKSIRLFGWVLWFLGSLGVLGKTLWSLWQRRASR